MRFPIKLAIGSGVALVFIVTVGFVMFPKMIKGQIKKMVNLKPGNEIRDMFLKIPFGLTFNVYIFTVLNPEEIHKGETPRLREIGPFCYEEWKTKINVEDDENLDTISYDPVDTFLKSKGPGPKCVSYDTEVTVPHPMILAMVNAVVRQKPGALNLLGKAINSIWSNPSTIFITVKAGDLLFDGVIIHCGVADFAGKAICSTLKAEPSLAKLSDDDLAFSLFGPKNGTAGKRITALRGTRDYRDVGRIVQFEGKPKMDVWNDSKCDAIGGTDGTIFPPMLSKEEGLASFAPDLCRSLIARYTTDDTYNGIPVGVFNASLGDQSKNPDEKCFCTTPDTCLKKGLIDLYKCAKIPIYASLPHFFDAHESYLKGVKGLKPDKEKHAIKILFESLTGSPVSARKRLQFSMPLEPLAKLDLFRNFTPTVLPIFWVEEAVDLNSTLTKPLKNLFLTKKIVSVMKYLILLGSIGGLGTAGYLYFKTDDALKISDMKTKPKAHSGISTVFNGNLSGGIANNGASIKY